MGNHEDKVFLKRFSGVIGVLVVITILIIIIANNREQVSTEDLNPSRLALTKDRIAPVGDVRTELPEAAPATAEAEVTEEVAAADIDGAAIYTQVCLACHMSGAAGAPIPGTDAWAERAAKGLEILVSSAVNGIGVMPPKGGRMDLSDAEIQAAVEHMLEQ